MESSAREVKTEGRFTLDPIGEFDCCSLGGRRLPEVFPLSPPTVRAIEPEYSASGAPEWCL